MTGLDPGEFVHTFGDAHLYENHLEQARLQLTRAAPPAADDADPLATSSRSSTSATTDFQLDNYDPVAAHRGPDRGMTVSLIVAMSEDRVIGRAGGLPWHLPADLARFKKITMGHAIVMGRKTYESIGRPLPGRRPWSSPASAISCRANGDCGGGLRSGAPPGADDDEIFIVGGAEVYRQALPLAQRMYVTRVHARVDGDVHFPDFDPRIGNSSTKPHYEADDRNPLPYSFQVFARSRPVDRKRHDFGNRFGTGGQHDQAVKAECHPGSIR